MNSLIESIIKRKLPVYFISPHQDDAILSAGALMLYLSRFTKVTVVNVFTSAEQPPFTMSAKKFIQICGYSDIKKLTIDRKKEDLEAIKSIPAECIDMSLIDALWRKKQNIGFIFSKLNRIIPEFGHVYPTYKFHINKGKISKHDLGVVSNIHSFLKKLKGPVVIFSPAGYGNHVDHIIVREACSGLPHTVIFWSDYPYNQNSDSNSYIDSGKFKSFRMSDLKKEKLEMLKKYKTQYTALFNGKDPSLPDEKYYYIAK